MNKKYLSFNDVLITPKFSIIASRKDVDVCFNGDGYPYMRLPIISSNMKTITESNLAKAMLSYGAQAALHRFCTIEENVKMFQDSVYGSLGDKSIPFVSVGLGDKELERAEALVNAGSYCLIVDVAHGASMSVVEQTKKLRELFKDNVSLTVGNFATGQSVTDFLHHSGNIVDGWKVGIGGGSLCSTRVVTGCGFPGLSTIDDIRPVTSLPLIYDGGLTSSGDCAKALGAGADMLMIGGLLAGTEETPGLVTWTKYKPIDGQIKVDKNNPKQRLRTDGLFSWVETAIEGVKTYSGSASKESYEQQGKTSSWRTPEGETTLVSYKGPVKNVLEGLEAGIRSAFSYVGASTLKEFQQKVEFVEITNAGQIESTPHAKK